MAKRRKQGLAFGDRSRVIREWARSYMHSLRALTTSLPGQYESKAPLDTVAVGVAGIWPCKDGTVVLIYQSSSNDVEVVVKDRQDRTMSEFISDSEVAAFRDEEGNRSPVPFQLVGVNPPKQVIHFARGEIRVDSKGCTTAYRPRFERGIAVGQRARLPEPDEQALTDFTAVFVIRNVAGPGAVGLPLEEGRMLVAEKASTIVDEFTAILANADKEEEVQRYLTEHPELIYADFIDCWPKFKLGDDFETDYVFLVQGPGGPQYVLVEIERPSKRIFTKKGHFTAEFTQAKDQLLYWETWVTRNHPYLSTKLRGLFKPGFHLVMGRDQGLPDGRRDKVTAEFYSTPSRVFSTYDDLAHRFRQLVSRVAGSSST